ncbi:MAG TPA: hypothetical protein VF172_09585 [Nitrososphaera sp.]
MTNAELDFELLEDIQSYPKLEYTSQIADTSDHTETTALQTHLHTGHDKRSRQL